MTERPDAGRLSSTPDWGRLLPAEVEDVALSAEPAAWLLLPGAEVVLGRGNGRELEGREPLSWLEVRGLTQGLPELSVRYLANPKNKFSSVNCILWYLWHQQNIEHYLTCHWRSSGGAHPYM